MVTILKNLFAYLIGAPIKPVSSSHAWTTGSTDLLKGRFRRSLSSMFTVLCRGHELIMYASRDIIQTVATVVLSATRELQVFRPTTTFLIWSPRPQTSFT
jgi:hypothetical protein